MEKNIKDLNLEEMDTVSGGGQAEAEQYLAELCKKYKCTRDVVMSKMSAAEKAQYKLLLSI